MSKLNVAAKKCEARFIEGPEWFSHPFEERMWIARPEIINNLRFKQKTYYRPVKVDGKFREEERPYWAVENGLDLEDAVLEVIIAIIGDDNESVQGLIGTDSWGFEDMIALDPAEDPENGVRTLHDGPKIRVIMNEDGSYEFHEDDLNHLREEGIKYALRQAEMLGMVPVAPCECE